MIMKDSEIRQEYRLCKFPREKIDILAELNGCSRYEILKIIDGVDLAVDDPRAKHRINGEKIVGLNNYMRRYIKAKLNLESSESKMRLAQNKQLLNQEVAVRIAQLIDEEGKTLTELSKLTGLGMNTLGYARRAIELTTVPTIVRICNYFQVSIDYVIFGKDPEGYSFAPYEWEGNALEEAFSDTVTRLVKGNGITFSLVADEAMLDASHFHKMISKKIKPSVSTLRSLSVYFDIPAESLVRKCEQYA